MPVLYRGDANSKTEARMVMITVVKFECGRAADKAHGIGHMDVSSCGVGVEAQCDRYISSCNT